MPASRRGLLALVCVVLLAVAASVADMPDAVDEQYNLDQTANKPLLRRDGMDALGLVRSVDSLSLHLCVRAVDQLDCYGLTRWLVGAGVLSFLVGLGE
jgi:hypothetical protein